MLPQQFAITEEYWKEWKNHYFVGAFIIVLTITAVTHLTHLVMISDYFLRIFRIHDTINLLQEKFVLNCMLGPNLPIAKIRS
jgi:hypothetical protein